MALASRTGERGRTGAGEGQTVSPATKLCGFLLLLVVVFAAAYASGAHLGPVAPSGTSPGGGPAHMSGMTP